MERWNTTKNALESVLIGMCDRDTNSESVAECEQTSRAHLRELAKLIQVSDNILSCVSSRNAYGGMLVC